MLSSFSSFSPVRNTAILTDDDEFGMNRGEIVDCRTAPDDCIVHSINNKYYDGVTIYIRTVNIERDGERYGTYYQAVRSYRESGRVKQEVIHLGEHQTADEALTAWERAIGELETTRPKQARKLQAKLDRLRQLSGVEQG
jgi:hypothetical protein